MVFDPWPLPSIDITANLANKKAVEGSRQLHELLVAGFRDRFPGLAAKYGLAVTADSSYRLRLRPLAQRTDCRLTCWARLTLRARLLDSSPQGNELWSSDVVFGLAVGANSVAEGAFDPLAEQVLQAMKKDGFIGR